jgi:hypothetical protein
MGDDTCDKLIERLRGDGVFTLFANAVTAALEEVLMLTQPARLSGATALTHLKRFAASCRTDDLEAAVAVLSGG